MNYRLILEKIAAGQQDPEEIAALQEWLQRQPLETYHAILMEYESIMLKAQGGVSDNPLLHRINEQIMARQPVIKRISWLKYAAAASIAVLVAVGGWWLYPAKQPAPALTIHPGKDKALLQLANGQQLELDSMATGTQWNAMGTAVAKTDTGMIRIANTMGNNTRNEFNELRTPRGGQFAMILPDGSRVWLNAASRLRFSSDFSQQRKVILEGEAYFDVVQNAALPFHVETIWQDIAVLGTGFNVMAYADEGKVSTTLLSGAISVQQQGKSTLLRPGQQATTENGLLNVEIVNTDKVIAWKKGRFKFDENDIKMIMRQVSRWYDVEIVYESDVSGITLSGDIQRKQHIDELLYVLEAAGQVRFKTKGQTIYVSRK